MAVTSKKDNPSSSMAADCTEVRRGLQAERQGSERLESEQVCTL